jgi:GT2 family glycosyltransferase
MDELTIGVKANIGVVIVNYNSGETLARCLESLSLQEYRDFITLVIDNGSSDGSTAGIRDRFPGVVVMETGENLGFAAANNMAFRIMKDSVNWFALLNPDAFPSPGWLAALEKASREHAGYASFGSRCYSDDGHRLLDGIGDEYHISGLVWRRGYGADDRAAYDIGRDIFSPCAAAALYSRQAVAEAGGFDEDFFCYLEDIDLGFRLRLLGYKSRYVPDATVTHMGSVSAGMRSDLYVYYGQRNIVWTWIKNMPSPILAPFLLLHIAMNLLGVIKYTLAGRPGIALKAKADAIRGIGRQLGKRRRIQAGRRIEIGALMRCLKVSLGRS